jgi:hypothetical protein
MSPSLRPLIIGLATVLLGACSFFSQTPDIDVRQKVADAAPAGTPMDTAQAQISEKGFSCSNSHGSFIDDAGKEHNPPEFVTCTEKPSRFEFTCEYRDYVYLIPKGGVVDEVYVVRGPNCLKQ